MAAPNRQPNVIIITSGGRTGTAFFAKLFPEILDDCVAYHEPESIDLRRVGEVIAKIRAFGLWPMTVGKMLGSWGITSLSHRRMSGRFTVSAAAAQLLREREAFIRSHAASTYVECSYHYYGLVDVLPRAFRNHRAAFIVRDGREWVRSQMNKRSFYHARNPHTVFATRISPRVIGDRDDEPKWHSLTRFQKLCWAWVRINEFGLSTVESNPNARLVRFEDVFMAEDRVERVRELIAFLTSFPDRPGVRYDSLGERLKRRENVDPTREYSSWREWPAEQVRQYKDMCAPLMARLGYGGEEEWRKAG